MSFLSLVFIVYLLLDRHAPTVSKNAACHVDSTCFRRIESFRLHDAFCITT